MPDGAESEGVWVPLAVCTPGTGPGSQRGAESDVASSHREGSP